jgi:nitroreductase
MSESAIFKTQPLRFRRSSPEEQTSAVDKFFESMQSRRTVRNFSSDPVPFHLIETAIRAAATAPSGANQQPWKFVVVSDPDVKRKIRAAAEEEEREFYSHRAPQE